MKEVPLSNTRAEFWFLFISEVKFQTALSNHSAVSPNVTFQLFTVHQANQAFYQQYNRVVLKYTSRPKYQNQGTNHYKIQLGLT